MKTVNCVPVGVPSQQMGVGQGNSWERNRANSAANTGHAHLYLIHQTSNALLFAPTEREAELLATVSVGKDRVAMGTHSAVTTVVTTLGILNSI